MAKEINKTEDKPESEKLTRRESLKKAGFYAATATGMIALLGTPKTSAAENSSPSAPGPW